MILLIDNYDSFTFNLVHFLGDVGARCEVVPQRAAHRRRSGNGAAHRRRSCCRPAPARRTRPASACDLIAAAAGRIPILGVCLGHQAIGQAFGGEVVRAPAPMHGKVSRDPSPGHRHLRRPALAVHRDALPQPDRRPRHPARDAGRHRLDRGRPDHGPAPPQPCRSSACSSIRKASPASTATTCWATSWPSPAAPTPPLAPPEPHRRVSNNLKPVLARLAAGRAAGRGRERAAFDIIMSGEATPAQIGGLLMAMRVRGETVPELTGAVRAMRARMTAVDAPRRRHRRLRHRRRQRRHAERLHRRHLRGGRLPASPSPSTATARCRRAPAAPTCWRRSASTSTCRWSACPPSCAPRAAPSCSRRATTPRCATPPARASNSAPARSSTCSARWPIRPA